MSDAENLLRGVLADISREHNYGKHEVSIKPITSEGANYTSVLFLANIKFPDRKDVELFAKVACVGNAMRDQMNATRLYYLETFFYTKLAKIYRALELKREVPDENRFILPKFYGCNANEFEETMVLENLTAKGYESYSRFISMDWDHAAGSVEALAKFHALSFAYQKDNPEEFDKVCEDLVFLENNNFDSMKEVFAKCVESALKVVKDEHKQRVVQFLESMGEDGFQKFQRPLGTKVIIHGDYRPSNLLFKKQGNKVQAIPVDYQVIHTGSPAFDLIYFEVCGTDSKFRADYHDRIIDHYYTELCAAMQRLGVDATEVFPRERLDSEIKEMTPMSIFLGTFLLPIVLVEADQAPRVDGDSSMECFLVTGNHLFAERFSGLVEDCVRWGAI